MCRKVCPCPLRISGHFGKFRDVKKGWKCLCKTFSASEPIETLLRKEKGGLLSLSLSLLQAFHLLPLSNQSNPRPAITGRTLLLPSSIGSQRTARLPPIPSLRIIPARSLDRMPDLSRSLWPTGAQQPKAAPFPSMLPASSYRASVFT